MKKYTLKPFWTCLLLLGFCLTVNQQLFAQGCPNYHNIVHWGLDLNIPTANFASFIDASGCSNITASYVNSKYNGAMGLTTPGAASTPHARNHQFITASIGQAYADSLDAFIFGTVITPNGGEQGCISELSFYYRALEPGVPFTTPAAQNFAVRVSANGTEIFEGHTTVDSLGMANWQYHTVDFTADPDFCVSSQTAFAFEIIPYNWNAVNYNPGTPFRFEVDEISLNGACCNSVVTPPCNFVAPTLSKN